MIIYVKTVCVYLWGCAHGLMYKTVYLEGAKSGQRYALCKGSKGHEYLLNSIVCLYLPILK